MLSTRLKDGMTTDSTGQPVPWWFDIYLLKESQRAEEFRIFTVNKSVTADGSLLSGSRDTMGPTGLWRETASHLARSAAWCSSAHYLRISMISAIGTTGTPTAQSAGHVAFSGNECRDRRRGRCLWDFLCQMGSSRPW